MLTDDELNVAFNRYFQLLITSSFRDPSCVEFSFRCMNVFWRFLCINTWHFATKLTKRCSPWPSPFDRPREHETKKYRFSMAKVRFFPLEPKCEARSRKLRIFFICSHKALLTVTVYISQIETEISRSSRDRRVPAVVVLVVRKFLSLDDLYYPFFCV